MRTLVWFRGKDLRIADHAPLRSAIDQGEVVPLFVLDPFFFDPERARELPHRMQFLLESLAELEHTLETLGSKLLLASGPSTEVVPKLARKWRVDRVVAHRWTEPFGRARDERVARMLDVPLELFEGELLLPPGTLRTGAGHPYSVFTPFARAFARNADIARPLPAPKRLPPLPSDVTLRSGRIPRLSELGIEHNPALLSGGELAGRERLRRFVQGPGPHYDTLRDRMDTEGTSRLSQDLKFGTVSVRTAWTTVRQKLGDTKAARSFLNELVWREFTHDTLWDRPTLLGAPFRNDFRDFPWRYDEGLWQAWARGMTGYPIVDASARQLLGSGFVHNRARMISASFLTKHLLIHYKHGEAHYMRYLTDGDWANNNAGWQWSAGCGCDAQPYFRVFNPVTQGKKFDPEGAYVRRWVPELAELPTRFVHAPWTAPAAVLEKAGLRLGIDYPEPIVDHAEARARFLQVAQAHLKRHR